MMFPIYFAKGVSAADFVTYWSPRYNYKNEHLYADNIGKPLTAQRIYDLFVWKNGSRLAAKKRRSVEQNYVAHVKDLKRLLLDTSAEAFLNEFASGGAIWRIFWLHCWQHERFPIYDQHVHRAMVFIEEQRVEEIPSGDADKVGSYVQRYLPFHGQFPGINSRLVDRALWFYGRFLKSTQLPLRYSVQPIGNVAGHTITTAH